ncbi:hypothetical protein [Vampirovibrio sp.]|uniref:hypothetical protein n=1 Tax=Vampirovibrio sp. TaxID=2717857 RepID=UPI003593E347
MTTLPTLSFSADNTLAKLLNRVAVLLLGTPPTVVDLGLVVALVETPATVFSLRISMQGGCHGHA